MAGIIYLAVTFLMLIISYYKSLNVFIGLFFLNALSIQFILAKLNFTYTNLSFVFLYIVILVLLILNITKNINFKYAKVILGSQIVFLLYISITSLIRGSIIEMLDLSKFYFFGSFLFLLIISSKKSLNVHKINQLIVLSTIILSYLGLFQYFTPSSVEFFMVDLSKFGYDVGDIDRFRRVIGLYFHPAHYGNLLSMLLLYTICLTIKNDKLKIPSLILYSGIIIGFISILFTGIRTSLVSFIVGILFLMIFSKNKKLLLAISFSVILLFLFWESITLIRDSYKDSEAFSNSLGRTLQLSSHLESKSVTTESTFRLTVFALDDFLKSPLIGSGDEMLWLQAFSVSDAQLFYLLVQFGIIGVFIIFYPYIFILSIKSNPNIKFITVFLIVLLVQTLNDTGIFYPPANFSFWIIAAIMIKDSNANTEILKKKYSPQQCHLYDSKRYNTKRPEPTQY